MKNSFTLIVFVLIIGSLLCSRRIVAQAPEKMSYQAVIRDTEGRVVAGENIGMQISILQGTTEGEVVYSETRTPVTNINGLVTFEIGGDGATVESGIFSAIDWSAGPYFIKTETDPSGGTDYTITGISQLLSVPYAFHAHTAESISEPIVESDPVFLTSPASGIESTDISNWDEAYSWGNHAEEDYLMEETQNLSDVLSQDNDAGERQIKNLAAPTDDQDAATKAYVDNFMPESYQVGDFAHGGVIFWLDETGQNGLVAAVEDWGDGAAIKGGSYGYATRAMGDGIYAGRMNTAIIIAVYSSHHDVFDIYASLVCVMHTDGGFGDWYLPSKAELNLMWQNLEVIDSTAVANGGSSFIDEFYWSSTEREPSSFWAQDFYDGAQRPSGYTGPFRVRPIRAF